MTTVPMISFAAIDLECTASLNQTGRDRDSLPRLRPITAWLRPPRRCRAAAYVQRFTGKWELSAPFGFPIAGTGVGTRPAPPASASDVCGQPAGALRLTVAR